MRLLVKARGFGTVEIEVEATELTLEVAKQAATVAELTEFPGAEYFTVYEAENVETGRVINVQEKRELVPSLVR